jgi:hypothetical protein
MANGQSNNYAKELINQIESDKKSVILFVSFDLALIALTLNFVIFKNNMFIFGPFSKLILIISLLAISLSAFLYFNWYRLLHTERIKITSYFYTNSMEELEGFYKMHAENGIYKKKGWILKLSHYSMGLGIFGYIFIIILLI